MIVILLGAELNSEVEHQTARDSTTGRERPRGDRGAVMADTVGRSLIERRPVPPWRFLGADASRAAAVLSLGLQAPSSDRAC